jgi:acetyl esterase
MSQDFYPLYPFGHLDAETKAVLEQISKSNSEPVTSMTPEQARKCFIEKSWTGKPDANVQITDIDIRSNDTNIPIRIYSPEEDGIMPMLLYFHGGGFVLGSIVEFDSFCTYLALGSNCIVVSVGYRLAPEHKHPAAVEDAKSALGWICNNAAKIKGDASRIAVAGDSAGGNLAAVISLLSPKKIIAQILICPWLDLSSTSTNSYKYFGDGLWLSTESIYWYRNHYLSNEEQAKSYIVSPLLAEKLNGVPPALILTSEFDVLRDEGEAYVIRLKEEGVSVKYKCYEGMLHDFITLPGLFCKAKDAISEICTTLKEVFNNKN